MLSFFFFFNDTATTEIYTLSLHDALPISDRTWCWATPCGTRVRSVAVRVLLLGSGGREHALATALAADPGVSALICAPRSEEHTSELQSRQYLVCRLLLEKKKKHNNRTHR